MAPRMPASPMTRSSACAPHSHRPASLPRSSSTRACPTPSTPTTGRPIGAKRRKMAGSACSTGSAATASLSEILRTRRLDTVFQPIFAFRESRMLGFEALVRGPAGSDFETPFALFGAAQREGSLVQLNIVCIQETLRAYARGRLPGLLFLNISPQLIVQRGFDQARAARFLAGLGLEAAQVVIELTEDYPSCDLA